MQDIRWRLRKAQDTQDRGKTSGDAIECIAGAKSSSATPVVSGGSMVVRTTLHVVGSVLGHVLTWHAGLHRRRLGGLGHLLLHRYARNGNQNERQK